MAQELEYIALPSQTGLSIIARIYLKGIPVGDDINCPEVDDSAIYVGDMPSIAAGEYTIRFLLDDDTFLASGAISWDGSQEVLLKTTPPLLSTIINEVFDLGLAVQFSLQGFIP